MSGLTALALQNPAVYGMALGQALLAAPGPRHFIPHGCTCNTASLLAEAHSHECLLRYLDKLDSPEGDN